MRFDDDKASVGKRWNFLQAKKQMEEVYVLLYTRSSPLEPVQDAAQLLRISTYAVGGPTQRFLEVRAGAAELSAEQADRTAKNREAALERRYASRGSVDAHTDVSLESYCITLETMERTAGTRKRARCCCNEIATHQRTSNVGVPSSSTAGLEM